MISPTHTAPLAALRQVLSATTLTDGALIKSPRLRTLFAYWKSLPRCPDWPRKSDIDPLDIRENLPHVLIARWDVQRRDFYYLICGGVIDEIHGVSSTKKHLRDIWREDTAREVIREYRQPIEDGCPYLYQVVKHDARGRPVSFERVLLPLSTTGETIDLLFGGVDPFGRTGRSQPNAARPG